MASGTAPGEIGGGARSDSSTEYAHPPNRLATAKAQKILGTCR